eukprot:2945539-Pyramimonas_sp.AAC.1
MKRRRAGSDSTDRTCLNLMLILWSVSRTADTASKAFTATSLPEQYVPTLSSFPSHGPRCLKNASLKVVSMIFPMSAVAKPLRMLPSAGASWTAGAGPGSPPSLSTSASSSPLS